MTALILGTTSAALSVAPIKIRTIVAVGLHGIKSVFQFLSVHGINTWY